MHTTSRRLLSIGPARFARLSIACWIVASPLVPGLLLTAAMQVDAGRADAAEPARKPNLIVILADDIGAAELGCYGHPGHQTPRLDRLAEAGVRFETCFTPPVCHPTRVMMLTGQYGCHNGVYNFPNMRGGPEIEDEGPDDMTSHVTFAQLLQQAGYTTAMAGKWQLSGRYPTVIRECGFDEYCLWAQRKDYYSPEQFRAAEAAGIHPRSRYWHPSVVRNGQWVPTTPDDYGPDLYNAFVLDFIRQQRERPFAIFYSMCLTHGPFHATPDSTRTPADRAENSFRKHYAANVAYMDKLVGRVIDTLDEQGLLEDTIVFFTGDNGTAGNGKSQATELGARVPMIVYGPGRVLPRGATPRLTDLSDILPTLVELGGARLPDDRPIDGRSYAAFLSGASDTTREWIFAFQGDRRILRTERWLLEDNSPLHYGRLYDCGDARDGRGYRDATESAEAEAVAARAYFDSLLAKLPAPFIPTEGPPNERKVPRQRAEAR